MSTLIVSDVICEEFEERLFKEGVDFYLNNSPDDDYGKYVIDSCFIRKAELLRNKLMEDRIRSVV